MQDHPMVAIPMANNWEWNIGKILNEIWCSFCCASMESKTFCSTFEAQQAGPSRRSPYGITHMAKTKIGSMGDGHGGDTGSSTILFIKLTNTGVLRPATPAHLHPKLPNPGRENLGVPPREKCHHPNLKQPYSRNNIQLGTRNYALKVRNNSAKNNKVACGIKLGNCRNTNAGDDI
jgi:hypothetical protein